MALPPALQVHSHFQPEEAAHAASELVSSLDNLPGEVVFLLEEIREKDVRINQLIQRINTRHMGLTKTAKSLSTLPPSTATFPLPIPQGSPLPTTHLSQKDAQNLTKIQAEWVKVEVLQDEKIKLAERMERIVNRARLRANQEWLKVGGKEVVTQDLAGMALGEGDLVTKSEMGHNDLILPPTGLGTGVDGRPQKKRKPNTMSLPSPASSLSLSMPPPPAPVRTSSHTRPSSSHRHPTSRHSSSVTALSDPDMDIDADGEAEDLDAEGEVDTAENENENENETDDTIYCICQQRSYGEMIGCDNDSCKYEWFHVKCVHISGPVPDRWFCPDCVKKLGLLSSDGKMPGNNRKNRKK
ncbi:hypothetical protein I302_106881 [Kwoniella bestiolae CBS 10118]|uniref:Chromatin modification-related protein n=1 Tax=Kwoniella bestiolae CBS 10118 TaxID=1296100 RepID=A0A1B9G048_9TREE|nr:hypothetical protein I302_05853 [Kwoniella bestiolae CBS 10118]OCF24393.1 hypothetical protein I302_05853 [Kwoniella bestiolae CBS 10118]